MNRLETKDDDIQRMTKRMNGWVGSKRVLGGQEKQELRIVMMMEEKRNDQAAGGRSLFESQ